jgi:hypothetical protein
LALWGLAPVALDWLQEPQSELLWGRASADGMDAKTKSITTENNAFNFIANSLFHLAMIGRGGTNEAKPGQMALGAAIGAPRRARRDQSETHNNILILNDIIVR